MSRKIREGRGRQRSRGMAPALAGLAIVLSGLPALLNFGPPDLDAALPLVVCAISMALIGARHAVGLLATVVVVVSLPIVFTHGQAQWDAIRNAVFVSSGTLILAWAHLRQRRRLQQRARTRRRIVGRAKNRAKQLQRTGSQLRLAVQRSEVAQQTLLEHLPVHVLQKDLTGRFTFVSQSFARLLNVDVKQILGHTDYDFFEPAIADKFRQDDQSVARDGSIIDDIERTQLPDGSVAYMQVRKAPLRDANGAITGVQGIFWDVTEALSGRKQLQRIESWAHALIQAALDAVLIVDVEGRVLEANPAVETILGYHHHHDSQHPPLGDIMRTGENVAGWSDDSSDGGPPIDGEWSAGTELGQLNRLLKQATGRRIEVRLRRPDDTWFEAEISAHPLVVENSSGWAIFIRDITGRKRSVAELQAAKEAAERANLAKSEFVANVSHELRTPLTGIVGLHELLERSELDDQQREYLALARTSSDNLLSLIDALLDFSKIEAQRLELESEVFDLIQCIESAAGSLAARAQLRGLELIIDTSHDLPGLVTGDQQRVRQVLLNLIGNAIKFTQRGDICVRVRRVPSHGGHAGSVGRPADRATIRFEVIDAGIGIAEESQAVIFEAFQQADSSTTRRYGGTGLGLAICRELVHLMGGEIEVSSIPNQGSTFAFTLPFDVVSAPPEASVAAEDAALQGSKIALVAQEAGWRNVLERELQELGCEVACISVEQLLAREPAGLFDAGNHTIVIADFRELVAQDPTSLPVVERVILAVPLAFARPTQTPGWLRHAHYGWLPRPICRDELRRALLDQPSEERAALSADEAASRPIRAADILLVEDSPINQTVLKGILEQLGHTVSLASNGAEAVNKCTQRRYDVVLMDIQMPEVDGLEATRRIRCHEQSTGAEPAHIIALTAHGMPSDREQARAAGMNGFLIKPIPLEALRAAIAAVPLAASDGPLEMLQPAPARLFNGPPDWGQLAEMLGGNLELAREVVDMLRYEAPRLVRVLGESCVHQEPREARRAAHTLKSNLRNLGLEEAASLAGQLERLAQAADWQAMAAKRSQLETSITEVVHWCDAMLASSPDSPAATTKPTLG
ncbi:MAG: ATP-binding protein [Aureliella sp.]